MIKDFIGVYPNAFSSDFCRDTINFFNTMEDSGFTRTESVDKHVLAKDSQTLYNIHSNIIRPIKDIHQEFLDVFWSTYYEDYANTYQILKDTDPHQIFELKIQKVEPGRGFHMWHYESSQKLAASRLLNVQLYLNTIEEGGETEFLYLNQRIKPEEGKLLVYPSSLTHTHRGNTPLKETKYIMNGWIEFT